ncbi:hypothetical protein H1R20_g4970, partial [Candolleomyces eurysporus]
MPVVTAESRGLSQQLENEREARNVERTQFSKDRSDEQQGFEAEKRTLGNRIVGLEQGLEAKEKARRRLEEDIAIVRREKDEISHVGASLQQQLISAKEAMKELQESADARVNSLQNDIDTMRDDRERQIASRDNQINVLNARLDEARNAPVQVTFNVRAETVCGENIFITGSIDQLKRWSPKNAVALSPRNYPIWTVTLSIPARTRFEYKYIRKFNGELKRWESDPNCSYSSPASGIATINDIWR